MEIVRTTKTNQTATNLIFSDLVDEYGTAVYRLCRSLTYSKQDAEDLFQETFLAALEQQEKLKTLDNQRGFLFSTCIYIFKSWKRKYARRKRLVTIEPLDETVISDTGMEERAVEREDILIVRKLVETLPDKFKIPVILHYTMELKVSDIALMLKLPAGTIKSRLFKARKLIEKGLGEIKYEK